MARSGSPRTGATVSDADEMLRNEQFVYANCVWFDGRFVAYDLDGDQVVLDERAPLDTNDLVDAFSQFNRHVDGATYAGGESTAHGSCGFFFKRGARGLEWALFSLESDPFVDVEVTPSQARFRSQSGDVWIVERDEVNHARIERRPRLAER
jgi:hypothetical protein